MSEFIDWKHADLPCPGCGEPLGGSLSTRAGQGQPKDGSLAICAYCNQISIFTVVLDTLGLRVPTDSELDEILKDPRVRSFAADVRTTRERHGGLR
jgi:hypothetical protein